MQLPCISIFILIAAYRNAMKSAAGKKIKKAS